MLLYNETYELKSKIKESINRIYLQYIYIYIYIYIKSKML